MSQTSKRTQVRPFEVEREPQLARAEALGVGEIDALAEDLFAVAGNDFGEGERERPFEARFQHRRGVRAAMSSVSPLALPPMVNSGINTSPVLTKNFPPRSASSTGCQPSVEARRFCRGADN